MPSRPDAIVFDLDGTLVDSAPGIEAACRAALAEVCPGRELPPLATHIGPPIAEVLRRVLDPAPEDLAALATRFREHYDRECWRATRPYPGAGELLAALAGRGVQAFVVTNKPAAPTAAILAALGWTSLREALSPDSRRPAYPDKAAAVGDLLARHALDAARTWLVGDAAADRDAALAHGLWFVPALYGYGGLDGPGLRAPGELLGLLDTAD